MPSVSWLRRRPRISIAVACAGIMVALAACSSSGSAHPTPTNGDTSTSPSPHPSKTFLANQDGKVVTLDSLRGKTVVVSPSLTLCQETCPLISADFRAADDAVRAAGLTNSVEFVEVTVDPQRDDQRHLKAYQGLFGASPDWEFLGGTHSNCGVLERAAPELRQRTQRPGTNPARLADRRSSDLRRRPPEHRLCPSAERTGRVARQRLPQRQRPEHPHDSREVPQRTGRPQRRRPGQPLLDPAGRAASHPIRHRQEGA